MRPAIRLAASLAPGTAQSSAAAATLIPPLALYRRILRAHRGLPAEQRVLGDAYVKEEFRRHRAVENPLHIVGFLSEWERYVRQVEASQWRDGKLDQAKLDKMSDEQIAQLYELLQAIRNDAAIDNDGQDPTSTKKP